jgi:hypothetical protein
MSRDGRKAAIVELRALFLSHRLTELTPETVTAVYRKYGLGGPECRELARRLYASIVKDSSADGPPSADARVGIERMRVLLGAPEAT